jgi:hypothetical protein
MRTAFLRLSVIAPFLTDTVTRPGRGVPGWRRRTQASLESRAVDTVSQWAYRSRNGVRSCVLPDTDIS